MQDLKVTIIQANLHWENIDKNLEMFSQKILSVKEETDLIVLPEMFSTGFTMNNKPLAENMNGKTFGWMKQMAQENNCVITGSIIIEENGTGTTLCNTTTVLGTYQVQLITQHP